MFLTAEKRLSDGWMLRGYAGWQDWRWDIPEERSNEDPTDLAPGGVKDGSPVLSGRGLGGTNAYFLNSSWSYSVTGLVQVARNRKWGFDMAGILGGREGYPIRYSYRVFRTFEDQPVAYVPLESKLRDARYPDTHVLDLRLAKSFQLKPTELTLSVDCFNALNAGYVLLRANVLGTGTGNWVTETLGPRTFRVGARLSLR